MARQCWQQLGLPWEQFDTGFLQWHDDYLGTGYGHPTTASTQAVNAAARSGLRLENTYTGKAFAAFLALEKNAAHPCLFWNTFNSHCR